MTAWLAGGQLLGLALFLGVVSQRVVHLWTRQRRLAVRVGLREGALPALLLALTNGWVLLVLARTIPLQWAWLQRLLGRPVLYAPLAWLGAALACGGFVLFVAAMRDLGGSWRLGIDTDHPGSLVTTGAYGVTRNPIYLFFDLYFLGTALMNGNLVFLVLLACMAAGLHTQIRIEERFLARVHGPRYAHYCRQTPRYVSLAPLAARIAARRARREA